MPQIKLAHGNGGVENNRLIEDIFYKAFDNPILAKSEDAAVIEGGKLAFTTDSFTVTPLFFAGGDIGKLAVCGTCNDLAMMGAKPKYLTCAFIIEEGLDRGELQSIVASMAKELAINGAVIVSGDTKVVPKGSVDRLFINTSGIGEIGYEGISASGIANEDVILVSRDIGCHGATIFAAREGMEMSSTLQSDCISLYPIVQKLIESGIQIKAMRDATRGGLAAVLNEWAKQSSLCIEIQEDKIPIVNEVMGLCELLGFEATALANEGTFVLATHPQDASKALEILQSFNTNASIIGHTSQHYPQRVVLRSAWGTARFLDMPSGELLPRIC
ncbi:MAG: hydrogenase assembly protein HupF [Sulfurovum sp. FS08-3]|nr:MAG: hydrogenase assembly protein HupF [Sulfurovum sp. FS08-3]